MKKYFFQLKIKKNRFLILVFLVNTLTVVATVFPGLVWCGSCSDEHVKAVATVFPGSEWEKASPESQGIDAAKLESAMDYLVKHYLDSGPGGIIVIRNGYNIWSTNDIHTPYNLYSAGKIWYTVAAGKMVEEGYLGLDSLVKDWDPLFLTYDDYKKVTLRHLLTFTSGYDAVNPEHKNKWGHQADDWSVTPFDPGPPLFAPNTAFLYWDDAVNMLSRVLTGKLGQTLESYVRSKITGPIGLTDFTWDNVSKIFPGYSQTKVNSVNIKGIYVHTSASQLARMGYLFLNKGNWGGSQLLEESFVEEATTNQVPVTIPLFKNINTDKNFIMGDHGDLDGRGIFGYMFWVNDIDAEGNRPMPDAPEGTYYAIGGWSLLFVIPEWDMVIARTGRKRPQGGEVISVYNETIKRIGQSFLK